MSQYTFTASLLLAFASLTGADLFGMSYSDSECTMGHSMVMSQGKSCEWTGECPTEGCSGKCVPAKKSHHDMDSLHMAKTMGAMKCSSLANMVQGMSSPDSMFSRKMLKISRAKAITDAEMQSTATRLFCSPKSFARPSAAMTQVLCPSVQAVSPAQAHVSRQLSDAEDQSMECPTAADIDEVAPTMTMMAGFVEAILSGAMFPASSPSEDETVHGPEQAMMNMLIGFMRDPEALKTFFEDECSTESVTEEPMLSMYAGMAMDDYSMSDDEAPTPASPTPASPTSASPTSVSVCRPKSGQDATFMQSMGTMAAACDVAMDEVPEGHCMYSTVAQSLHTECFETTAGILGIPEANQATILQENGNIGTACRAATDQAACEEIDMHEAEGTIALIMEDLEAAAVAEVTAPASVPADGPASEPADEPVNEPSDPIVPDDVPVSDPSHASVPAEGRAMGIIMVAITGLFAGFL